MENQENDTLRNTDFSFQDLYTKDIENQTKETMINSTNIIWKIHSH